MTEAEWTDWSRTHKACWEVNPLIEAHDGKRLQVGFEFNVFAQFPPSVTNTDERQAEFPKLRAQLEELAAAVFPAEGTVARFEIAPIETAVRLRAEAEFAPEMMLTVRVFHKQEYFEAVDAGDRQKLAPLEARLKAHGLKARSWGRA